MLKKKFLRDYLLFSRRDRIGIVSLLCLVLIVYFLPNFYSHSAHRFPISQSPELSQALDSLQRRETGLEDEPLYSSYSPQIPENILQETRPGELFSFDPNTLPPEGWQRLGLPSRSIRTIMNYRSKGGRFRQPSDLQKVWGLPPGFYERVKDHISIIPQQQHFTRSSAPGIPPKPEKRTAPVHINTADTSAFITLPGIGSKLASRITSFREKLGGFYSVDQVAETFGLPDSTFQKIKPYLVMDNIPVRKLSINTATVDELKSHPYIRWSIAKAIIAYRQQHGKFNSLDELKKISLIDEVAFEKMKPYLEVR